MYDGVIKFLKIVGWVAASGALTAILEYVKDLQIDPDKYVLVAFVGLVNAILAGLAKWLSTKK